MGADRNRSAQRLFAPGQGGGQVQAEVGIEHAHAFLGQARGDFAVQLHRAGIDPVTQFHGQGEHVDIGRQLWQREVAIEQGLHQAPFALA